MYAKDKDRESTFRMAKKDNKNNCIPKCSLLSST